MLRPVLCRPVLRVRCVLHELIEMIIAQKIMLRKQQKRIDPSSRMHRREHVGNIPFFAPYQIHADAAKKQSIFRLLFAVSFLKPVRVILLSSVFSFPHSCCHSQPTDQKQHCPHHHRLVISGRHRSLIAIILLPGSAIIRMAC